MSSDRHIKSTWGLFVRVAPAGMTQVDFCFMDKQEIKNRLIASRELHTMSSGSRNWKDAFKAYEQATGIRLDTGCNKCFQRILDWLNEA